MKGQGGFKLFLTQKLFPHLNVDGMILVKWKRLNIQERGKLIMKDFRKRWQGKNPK